jgi:hypothetical protein
VASAGLERVLVSVWDEVVPCSDDDDEPPSSILRVELDFDGAPGATAPHPPTPNATRSTPAHTALICPAPLIAGNPVPELTHSQVLTWRFCSCSCLQDHLRIRAYPSPRSTRWIARSISRTEAHTKPRPQFLQRCRNSDATRHRGGVVTVMRRLEGGSSKSPRFRVCSFF